MKKITLWKFIFYFLFLSVSNFRISLAATFETENKVSTNGLTYFAEKRNVEGGGYYSGVFEDGSVFYLSVIKSSIATGKTEISNINLIIDGSLAGENFTLNSISGNSFVMSSQVLRKSTSEMEIFKGSMHPGFDSGSGVLENIKTGKKEGINFKRIIDYRRVVTTYFRKNSQGKQYRVFSDSQDFKLKNTEIPYHEFDSKYSNMDCENSICSNYWEILKIKNNLIILRNLKGTSDNGGSQSWNVHDLFEYKIINNFGVRVFYGDVVDDGMSCDGKVRRIIYKKLLIHKLSWAEEMKPVPDPNFDYPLVRYSDPKLSNELDSSFYYDSARLNMIVRSSNGDEDVIVIYDDELGGCIKEYLK